MPLEPGTTLGLYSGTAKIGDGDRLYTSSDLAGA